MKYIYIAVALLSLAFGACTTGPTEKRIVVSVDTVCVDPRPEVCTTEYVPVCATLQDGSSKTYSNGCSACADSDVKSWIADVCPE